jgi:hypothetical protein
MSALLGGMSIVEPGAAVTCFKVQRTECTYLEEMHKARHGCELARWNNHSS